jgi:peptidoglycan-associated lipoprotein
MLRITLGLALTLSSLACNKQGPGVVAPADPSAQTVPVGAPAPRPDPALMSVTAVGVDRRLAEMCGLRLTEIFFEADSANLQPEAREELERLASCLTLGPAKDRSLVVVGRASPPGSEEYNQALGVSRAESVATYLRALGVNRSRVEIESRGERDATARPEAWPLERRVSVHLQE